MLSWISVDLNTGSVIADLPDLSAGSAKQTLMRYESMSAALPLDRAPSAWRNATRPYSAALLLLDDDAATPLWGGIVTARKRGHGAAVSLDLATVESYFEARYVGNETYTGVPQGTIVEDLVTTYAKTGARPGLPLRVQHDGALGQARDRTYLDEDDKTLYAVLDELAGVIDGPEWTVDWEANGAGFRPVLRTAQRLGRAPSAGLGPNAVFSLPGPVTSFEVIESFKAGAGANDVMATSSGTGDARPQSPHQLATGDNRPSVEYRWSPSTSITDTGTLAAHAQRALAAMREGTLALTITANRAEAPKLGHDWRLGDDVGFDLTAPGFPDGLTGTARAIGWQLDETTVSPVLLLNTVEGLD